MGVGILIISHDGIGESLCDTADHMVEDSPLKVKCLSVSRECDPDKVLDAANSLINELDKGNGVLVLTDLLGSTPSNIAHRLNQHKNANINIITGINLSMLIRIYNYPDLNLTDMTTKAYSGGIDGITIANKL
ncbi:MAG TPA: PTS fructose transporter subunit IIA [Thiotrichaceae bacterium]|jgi:PTS system ascorbate-specific IIA component|nr:PTS fructose transporter subunit IIA [Thiotrichaceae bacterium]HIM07596.1 PTS fructose transporter subunit IIA [Gammaproteobacteria bacterium]